MKDFSKMSRADLIARLEELECDRTEPIQMNASKSDTPQNSIALLEAEERMRAILETAVDGIVTIDQNGVVELMNPAAERIFGYHAAEVTGKNVSILMPSPDRERHDSYISNYLLSGQAKIIGI